MVTSGSGPAVYDAGGHAQGCRNRHQYGGNEILIVWFIRFFDHPDLFSPFSVLGQPSLLLSLMFLSSKRFSGYSILIKRTFLFSAAGSGILRSFTPQSVYGIHIRSPPRRVDSGEDADHKTERHTHRNIHDTLGEEEVLRRADHVAHYRIPDD